MSRVYSWLQSFSAFSSLQSPVTFDFGSTTTRVLFEGKLLIEEPTCIAMHTESNAVVAIGSKAVSLLGKVSESFSVVFPVSEGEITSVELATAFLETLAKRISSKMIVTVLGLPAVVVVPTNLSPVQRTIYTEVFLRAGFRSVTLVSLSKALLKGFGDTGARESFCYFDLGGQKSECGIFTLGECIESRQFRIGGVHLTELVQRRIRLEHNLEISWHGAEQVKKTVCTVAHCIPEGKRVAPTKIAVRGKDVVTQAGKTVVVSSDIFDDSLAAVVEELVDELQFFFSVVPAHLVAATLESGIHLSGGLGAMAGVRELLEATFQAPVRTSKQPHLDGIYGLL